MKAKGLNASSTQQYFWQQMTEKVFPSLNKTISVWRADDPNRGAFATNLPAGSVLNVYQSLMTAWHQTLPAGTDTVVSMAGDRWCVREKLVFGLMADCTGSDREEVNCCSDVFFVLCPC
eukprot:COSAG02_NODE_45642_length_355_cov_0.824219_1_plen_118_part_11